APPPFTGGTLLPLGLDDDSPWLFPARAKKTLAISPFLNTGTLARLRAGTADATLLTRADSADQLGAAATADWDVHVLDAAADYDHTDGGAAESELGVITADDDVAAHHVELTGLHAKTVVLEQPGGQSRVLHGNTYSA